MADCVKLSPTQLRVLRYASEGRLNLSWSGGAFAKDTDEVVRSTTVDKLFVLGLVSRRSFNSTLIEVTPKGAALLEEQEGT